MNVGHFKKHKVRREQMSEVVLDSGQAVSPALANQRRNAIAAGIIGTVVEWYDYAVYGFLATIIARQFFPSENETTALLAAFATLGIGFLARPLGGIGFGWIGDAFGRRTALVGTFSLMAVSTFGIGLIPNHASIGIAAPILLVACRLAQGFSAGGEWGSATAFMVEWAPSNRRGLFGSFQQSSVAGGLLLGSGIAALASALLAPEQMNDWGWRIPFLLGGVLLPIGIYTRRNVDETPVFREAESKSEVVSASKPWLAAARAFGFTVHWTVGFYVMLVYMPTFSQKFLNVPRDVSLWSNTLAILLMVIAIPLMGLLSDRIGRKPVMLASAIGYLVLGYPLFHLLLTNQSQALLLVIQAGFAIMLAAFSGPAPAAIAELFATNGRATWMSTAYSLCVAIFGGFAPYIVTWLIDATGKPISPSYYLVAAAAISTITVFTLKETAHSKLA
jgi:MHS family proline/betaine transporter-like MFS transporter